MTWKRSLLIGAGLLTVTVVCALAYVLIDERSDEYAHRIKFDSQGWRDRAADSDPSWPTRLRMIDDLLAAKRLDGVARDRIESLLGTPDKTDKWKDWDLVYWLGPERGFVRIDSEWLVIRFGSDGRVATYRVVRD